jgi:putative photosynthetic complex assembly protein 2
LTYGLAIVFALFVWWFSTGAVLYVVGLPRRTFAWSMATASAVLVLALLGLVATGDDTTAAGAYCAFTCGLLVWAWHEMSFLTGFVTGPRPEPCPEGATGWRRFTLAAQTLLYHEVAILVTAGLVVVLTWGAPNRIGVLTFMVLWVMRLSAKLNVFLGVPNLTEEFLPANLSFLKSYFSKRPMNLLFPLSVTGATLVTWFLIERASAAGATDFTMAGYTLLATLMALAVLEHWLLVLPLPAAALWSWGLKSRQEAVVAPGIARAKPAQVWIEDEVRLVSSSGR